MTAPEPPPGSPPAVATGLPRLRAHLGDPLHRTSYLLLVGAGAGSLLGFLFWGLAARGYPARVVGLNSTAISAMMFVSGVCQLGMKPVLVRYLPTAGHMVRAFVLRTYALTVAISVVLGSAAAATSELWSPSLGFLAREPGWFAGFAFSTALWTIFTLQDSVLTALKGVPLVPISNSAYSVVKLAVLLAVIGLLPFSGPFVAWNLPLLATVAIVTYYVFRRLIPRYRSTSDPKSSIDRRQVISVARGNYGGTLFALAAVMLLPILVTNAEGAEQTAFFYVPWTISMGLQLVALSTTTSLTVEAALDEPGLRQLTRRTLVTTMWLVVPLAAVSALAAPWILAAFGSSYATEGATLLALLAIAAVPNVLQTLGVTVARLQHRGRLVLAIHGAQCVLALGLSALLLPRYGIEGVGMAWLLCQVFVAIGVLAGPLRLLLLTRAGDRHREPLNEGG